MTMSRTNENIWLPTTNRAVFVNVIIDIYFSKFKRETLQSRSVSEPLVTKLPAELYATDN